MRSCFFFGVGGVPEVYSFHRRWPVFKGLCLFCSLTNIPPNNVQSYWRLFSAEKSFQPSAEIQKEKGANWSEDW